ncbi:MAG: hypothetical protein KDK78_04765, partial [Chlamydiia bacterium]|nr:hypothetical protein [Chlamydiia bacterium]
YNSLLLACRTQDLVEDCETLNYSMRELLHSLRQLGIRVFVQPEPLSPNEDRAGACPLRGEVRGMIKLMLEDLQRALPGIDGIYWTSLLPAPSYMTDPFAREALLYDVLLAELRLLESSLEADQSLIFSVPFSTPEHAELLSTCLQELCDDAGARTQIAFPALAGDPAELHRSEHPLWNSLHSSPDLSATGLLPIVNAGAVSHGAGLWPSLPLRQLDTVFSNAEGTNVAGAIVLADKIPSKHGLAHCSLWACGQRLWRPLGIGRLMETWCKAYRPDWSTEKLAQIIATASELDTALSRLEDFAQTGLRKDEDPSPHRTRIESLVSRLNAFGLEGLVDDTQVRSTLEDYTTFFVRDSKRRIHQVLTRLNLSMASVLHGDDLKEAFWTVMDAEPGRGIVAGAQVSLLKSPNKGVDGSRLRLIYDENMS